MSTDRNTIICETISGRQADRRKAFTDRHVLAIEAEWRRRYLAADPTATDEDFARDLPELQDALRRRRVLGDAMP